MAGPTLSWLDKKRDAADRLVPPCAVPDGVVLTCPICHRGPVRHCGVQLLGLEIYLHECRCLQGHSWMVFLRVVDVELHTAQVALKNSREQLKEIERREEQILRAYTGGQYDRQGEDDAAAVTRFKEDHEPVRAERKRLDGECDRLLAEVKRLKRAVRAAGIPRVRFNTTGRPAAGEVVK
jgi:hypothetical protein